MAETPDAQIASNRMALVGGRAATHEAVRQWEAAVRCSTRNASTRRSPRGGGTLVRRAQGKPPEPQTAEWMVAWTLRLLGRTEAARERQRALKAALARARIEDPYVDEELALVDE